MTREKGKPQKRKERLNKRTNILCIILLFGVILLFTYGLVQEAVNIRDINHQTLNSYTGTCKYEYHISFGRHRSNYYLFTLDNGDVVFVTSNLVENEDNLIHCTEFDIQYSTIYSNPFYRRYAAVSITSADGAISFLNVDRAHGRSVESVWICSVMLLLLAGFLTVFLLLIYTAYGKQRYIRY